MDVIAALLVFYQPVGPQKYSCPFCSGYIDTTRKNNFGQVNWYTNKLNQMGI